jgi:hypothetical protein
MTANIVLFLRVRSQHSDNVRAGFLFSRYGFTAIIWIAKFLSGLQSGSHTKTNGARNPTPDSGSYIGPNLGVKANGPENIINGRIFGHF